MSRPPIRHWLLKSEPDVFSFDDLWQQRGRTTAWEGVRNYQARNFMRDGMTPGDGVLFYHSSCAEPGVVGLAEVASVARPDPTQFDPRSPYFDPGSERDAPRWLLVDVKATRRLAQPVALAQLKADPRLVGMAVAQKGSRLSVQPVEATHWCVVLELAGLGK